MGPRSAKVGAVGPRYLCLSPRGRDVMFFALAAAVLAIACLIASNFSHFRRRSPINLAFEISPLVCAHVQTAVVATQLALTDCLPVSFLLLAGSSVAGSRAKRAVGQSFELLRHAFFLT